MWNTERGENCFIISRFVYDTYVHMVLLIFHKKCNFYYLNMISYTQSKIVDSLYKIKKS